MSFNENGSHNRTESERVFFQIIEDLEENFKWIDLSEVKDNSLCAGLPIVLLDVYISNQILQMISESYNHETELQSFFSYVENVLCGSDSLMIECFQTTLIEKIASETKSMMESVLHFCGTKTKQSILEALACYYGNSGLAEELGHKYL